MSAFFCTASLLASMAGPVELRSGDIVDAPVEAVSRAGVLVGGGQQRTIAWDRVARVTGPLADEAFAYADYADRAWRARTRLLRGDLRSAAPLFEDLYEDPETLEGPTGLLIAEGTMRCRIASDPRGAVDAWLLALALRAGGEKIDGEPVADGFTDSTSGLLPALPPIFLHRGHPAPSRAFIDDERASALAALYDAATGTHMPETLLTSSTDPVIEFVRLLVLAQHGSADERAAAVRLLKTDRRPAVNPVWGEAWTMGAIGRAMVQAEDADDRIKGVITLLEIPARWGDTQPHLSAVALHIASTTLDDLGRTGEASTLRDELRRAYPDHPAAREQDDETTTATEQA